MRTRLFRHTGPCRRVAALSLVAGLVASCSTRTQSPKQEQAAGQAGQTDVTLWAHITEVRQSLRLWDLDNMIGAAEALQSLDIGDANKVFLRDYWRATALFNAMLAGRERGTEIATPYDQTVLREETVRALSTVLAHHPGNGDCHAMLETVYGLRVQAQPLRALTLGPLLLQHGRAAASAIESSPRVGYLKGVALFNRARDDEAVSQALNTLLEAETLFEAESQRARHPGEPDWGREHNWMFIGEAYERLAQPDEAMAWLERAYRAAPGLARAQQSYERCRKTVENKSQ